MEKTSNTKLSPPWYVYHRKVKALFGNDPEIQVKDLADIGNGEYSYIMHISNKEKAEAIKVILPQNIKMGNITINAAILGPDEDEIKSSENEILKVIDTAFSGNPIFEKTIVIERPNFSKMYYCIFKKEVVQFWNDDLSDYCGNFNGLASDIAKEILNANIVQFCISAE